VFLPAFGLTGCMESVVVFEQKALASMRLFAEEVMPTARLD
jgi:hypothetical protein